MTPLIVYYSLSGNNRTLAFYLQQQLQCEAYAIKEINPRKNTTIFMDITFGRLPRIALHDLHLKQYDLLIFIAPVWVSHIATPLKAFIKHHREEINAYSFISVCGGQTGQHEKLTAELTHLIGKKGKAVVELPLSSLPEENAKNLSTHHLEKQDLKTFLPAIDDFICRSTAATISIS